jgi:hypothetical protein
VTDRAALTARLARLLADAIVRELRAEMAGENESPCACQSDTGSATCAGEARTDEQPTEIQPLQAT